jgi:hypothetical protein
MTNGSHRPGESHGKQERTEHKGTRQSGSALSAAPALQQAVTKLCSVKKVRVGKVTAKLDEIFEQNLRLADARRATKKDEEIAAETRRIQKKGVKFNTNMEEPLASTVADLMAPMSAMENAVGVCKNYLKRQFNARLMRAEADEFKYPSIGDEYRTHNKKSKLKMTPNDNRNELDYLKALVILMMKADARRGSLDTGPLKLSGLLRKVPTLSVQGTNKASLTTRRSCVPTSYTRR